MALISRMSDHPSENDIYVCRGSGCMTPIPKDKTFCKRCEKKVINNKRRGRRRQAPLCTSYRTVSGAKNNK